MASPKTRRAGSGKKNAPPAKRAHKKPAKRAAAPKKAASTGKGKAAKSVVAKKPARKKSTGFGRVRVPIDARLDLVFQKDYQAREVFDFLKVQTIRDLEQFAPDEIFERLTGPMQQTVLRIRKTLALVNRHLARDEKFAKEFLRQLSPPSTNRRSSQN
jgi:hypothetical protein